MRFQLDLMVQFLFKQGQVELEGTNLIPDYTDAILINRTIIEELNSMIWVTIFLFSKKKDKDIKDKASANDLYEKLFSLHLQLLIK